MAELELFFDGDCQLCSREMAMLQRLDRGRGRIAFVDIAAEDFDPASVGRSEAELMARIHARDPNGEWVEGMEVFRRAYRAVHLGWLLAPTGWPGLRPLFDAGYRWFARNRYWISGRRGCEGDRCANPPRIERERERVVPPPCVGVERRGGATPGAHRRPR